MARQPKPDFERYMKDFQWSIWDLGEYRQICRNRH